MAFNQINVQDRDVQFFFLFDFISIAYSLSLFIFNRKHKHISNLDSRAFQRHTYLITSSIAALHWMNLQ